MQVASIEVNVEAIAATTFFKELLLGGEVAWGRGSSESDVNAFSQVAIIDRLHVVVGIVRGRKTGFRAIEKIYGRVEVNGAGGASKGRGYTQGGEVMIAHGLIFPKPNI